MTTKRIAVLGAGANGASIGADLTRAGLDVVLIDQWPEHVQAMRTRGLRIEMPEETLHLPVRAYNLCDVCTFTERFDIVLLVTKAYDTRWSCQLIEPYLKADGLVAGVQNGMTVDVIADVVGPDRTMGCVIEISSMMFDPGVVQRHSPPPRSWFAVGSIDAGDGRPREGDRRSAAPRRRGRDRRRHPRHQVDEARQQRHHPGDDRDPRRADARGRQDARHARADAALRPGGARYRRARSDIGCCRSSASPRDDIRQTNRLVETLLDTLLAGFVLPHTKTTVLQDWMKGRHSEVDDLNGLVVAERARRGGAAPVNAAVVEIAHRIERGELAPGPDNLALLRALAGG